MMKRLVLTTFLILLTSRAAFSQNTALTLEKAYQLSLGVSESIAQKEETIQEAQGHFYQAFNVLMPTVEFVVTRTDQDVSKQPVSSDSSGITGNSLRRSTPLRKFTFSQPLFSGFKQFAALSGAGAEKAQRRFEKKRAEELLMVDVADAFYTLAEASKDVQLLDEIHELMEQRMTELKTRENLGRSRTSEVQSAISEIKLVEADRIEAERVEKIARSLLEFYIGQPIQGGLDEGSEEMYFKENQEVASYLSGYDKRSDIRAADEAYRLEQKRVLVAQSGFLPNANFDANAYTQRVGSQSGIDWDATLTVNVPIFDGMQTIGDVKAAAAKRQSAKLELSRTRRIAQREIQDAYENFYSSIRSEAALKQAAEASEQNYKLQSEDYRLSLVNNLEVLDALRRYEDLKRRQNSARFELFKNYWKLKVAGGQELR